MKKSHKAIVTQERKTLLKNWEKYRGNIVMVVGEEVFSTKKASQVSSLVKKIEKKFHRRPLITYIPEDVTLVLFA